MKSAIDYTHAGGFDRARFATAFESRKQKHPYSRVRFSPAAVINAWTLIQMMQADSRVSDIRWMAYMLATAFWEAAHTVKDTIQVPRLGKGRKPVLARRMVNVNDLGSYQPIADIAGLFEDMLLESKP